MHRTERPLREQYRKIAYGLKKVKETAHPVSEAAKRLLDIIKVNDDPSQTAFMEIAKTHFATIADPGNAWPDITPEALSSEQSIQKLFQDIQIKLQDPKESQIIIDHFNAYDWIAEHLYQLNGLLKTNGKLNIDASYIHNALYEPIKKLMKLRYFFDELDQSNPYNPLSPTDLLPPPPDLLPREEAPVVSIDPSRMLNSLRLFCPELANPEFTLDLNTLDDTISAIHGHNDLKTHLNALVHSLRADIEMQKCRHRTTKEIEMSKTMQLCRDTNEMLHSLLRSRSGDPDTILEEQLAAIHLYKNRCDTTQLGIKILMIVGAVIYAALMAVVMIATITGLSMLAGSLFGPAGTVAGAVCGLIHGTYSAIGASVVAFSTFASVLHTIAFFKTNFFAPDPLTKMAFDIADRAENEFNPKKKSEGKPSEPFDALSLPTYYQAS